MIDVLFFCEVDVIKLEIVNDEIGWDKLKQLISTFMIQNLLDLLSVLKEYIKEGRDELIWNILRQ